MPFKIVLQKGLTVDLKSLQVWLVGKSGAGKTTTLLAFLAHSGSGSQVYLVDGKNELQALFLTSYNASDKAARKTNQDSLCLVVTVGDKPG